MTWMVLKHPRPTKALAFVEWARDCPLTAAFGLKPSLRMARAPAGRSDPSASPRRGHQDRMETLEHDRNGARPRYPVWSSSSSVSFGRTNQPLARASAHRSTRPHRPIGFDSTVVSTEGLGFPWDILLAAPSRPVTEQIEFATAFGG